MKICFYDSIYHSSLKIDCLNIAGFFFFFGFKIECSFCKNFNHITPTPIKTTPS